MNEITLLAKSGLGWQGIGGIILLLTGIGLIYFGIKALQGYRFFPEQEHNIPEEDHKRINTPHSWAETLPSRK